MELKLLSVTLGLARDAISSGCITRQYPILTRIKMGTRTLQDPRQAVHSLAYSGLGASGKIGRRFLGSLYIALVARLV